MLELTSKSKTRKRKELAKIKFSLKNLFSKPNFIPSIIQKLNYFDLLIILVLLAVTGFLIYNRIQRKNTSLNIRVAVENADWWYGGNPPQVWYAADLKKGDTSKDSFGGGNAEVINVENYDNAGPYRNIYVDLKIDVQYDKSRNQYLYQYKPISVGSSVVFNFSNQQIQGLIVKMGDKSIDYKYQTIVLQKKSFINTVTNLNTTNSAVNTPITAEVARQYKVGDKSLDNNNDLVAEVLNIKNDISSYYTYSDIRGAAVKVFNPDYSDLTMTLKIKTYNQQGLDFFVNQTPIKLGSKIWIQFPNYSLENYEIVDILK